MRNKQVEQCGPDSQRPAAACRGSCWDAGLSYLTWRLKGVKRGPGREGTWKQGGIGVVAAYSEPLRKQNTVETTL